MRDDFLAEIRKNCVSVAESCARIRKNRERLAARAGPGRAFSALLGSNDARPKSRTKRIILAASVAGLLAATLAVFAILSLGHHDTLIEAGSRVIETQGTAQATPIARVPAESESAIPSDAKASPASQLPDKALTPGVVAVSDPKTVCQRGYAKSVRPVGAQWNRLKSLAYERYGIRRGHRSYFDERGVRHPAYQVDHLIPIELGGAPDDVRNLWPEPIDEAKRKDRVEDKLHHMVCEDNFSLTKAQDAIRRDWRTATNRAM